MSFGAWKPGELVTVFPVWALTAMFQLQ